MEIANLNVPRCDPEPIAVTATPRRLTGAEISALQSHGHALWLQNTGTVDIYWTFCTGDIAALAIADMARLEPGDSITLKIPKMWADRVAVRTDSAAGVLFVLQMD